MPVRSITGELLPRKKVNESNSSKKKKKRNLSRATPARIIKTDSKTARNKRKNNMTEEQAKYISEMREAEKLRKMFLKD